MENTFDINNFSEEEQGAPATYPQCKGLGYHFAGKQPNGKPDYKRANQIKACLYGLAKREKHYLTFKKADSLFKKKTLPKVYSDSIALYLKENKKS